MIDGLISHHISYASLRTEGSNGQSGTRMEALYADRLGSRLIPIRHVDAGTTIAFAVRIAANAVCTLSTGGVFPTFQLSVCLL